MIIDITKTYTVIAYTTNSTTKLGNLPGTDVKNILKGYTYDADFGLWFTPKATKSYEVTEA